VAGSGHPTEAGEVAPVSPDIATARVARYFDGLYSALAASRSHARIGREALGDAFVGQLGYAGEGELLRLAEVAGVGRGKRVLDLCCGAGGVATWYARRTGAEVLGVDCSVAGLRLGVRALDGPPSARFVVGDVRRLPVASRSIDAIVCLDGFGADFVPLAAEAARVLRRGGGLALLLSLPPGHAGEVVESFRRAGFGDSFWEDRTAEAAVLMRRWLDGYRRHAREHIAEVGERYHHGLANEISDLLDVYASGATERVLLGARRR
jgi:SAM-dependent methyltransferase